MADSANADPGRTVQVLTSAVVHAQLLRHTVSRDWAVVEEHWAGAIPDEQVWREFGHEPWRRWSRMEEGDPDAFLPAVAHFVSRRLLELATAEGCAVFVDNETAFAVACANGSRVDAWFEPGGGLRLGTFHDGLTAWIETNDLSALERLCAGVIREDGADAIRTAHVHSSVDDERTQRWGHESWLKILPGSAVDPERVLHYLEHGLA